MLAPRRSSLLALACLCLTAPALAQVGKRADTLRKELEEKVRHTKVYSGQRHLELGVECRKKGLTSQAAVQILLAVEVSDRQNPGANTVLHLMRTLDDDFWKKKRNKPSQAKLNWYDKQAKKVREQNLEERFDVALWAHKKGLEQEARVEFEDIMRDLDLPLEADSKGRLVTAAGKVPAEPSAAILADAVQINGRPYLRDAFLQHLADWGELFEVESDELRVRTQTSLEDAQALHSLASALLPTLEADLGGRSDWRPTVFVFAKRSDYEAYLNAAGLGSHAAVAGLADARARTAVICGEDNDAEALNALVLHELTHLVAFGISPTVMPSWYSEGLADTYGGQGTFEWENGELVTIAGLMPRERLTPLLEPERRLSFDELFAADALQLWNSDKDAAQRFYAQSWAVIRFFRSGAGGSVAAEFERWEQICRGTALGAQLGNPMSRESRDSRALFERMFAKDLPELEAEFVAWLEAL
jgi:hypothetical protein